MLHELGMQKRWDCLTQLVAQCAFELYWFNPLVWVAWRRIQAERERACDDLVLNTGTRPSTYAEHLLHSESAMPTLRFVGAAAAMARPSTLEERLRAILDAREPRGSCVSALATFVLLVGALMPWRHCGRRRLFRACGRCAFSARIRGGWECAVTARIQRNVNACSNGAHAATAPMTRSEDSAPAAPAGHAAWQPAAWVSVCPRRRTTARRVRRWIATIYDVRLPVDQGLGGWILMWKRAASSAAAFEKATGRVGHGPAALSHLSVRSPRWRHDHHWHPGALRHAVRRSTVAANP